MSEPPDANLHLARAQAADDMADAATAKDVARLHRRLAAKYRAMAVDAQSFDAGILPQPNE